MPSEESVAIKRDFSLRVVEFFEGLVEVLDKECPSCAYDVKTFVEKWQERFGELVEEKGKEMEAVRRRETILGQWEAELKKREAALARG